MFAVYAAGFAVASLTWPRAPKRLRAALPVAGPIVMAGALVVVGSLIASGRRPAEAAPFLLLAGAGHASGFSPLTSRLTSMIDPSSVADLSGLLLTASLVGTVIGTAAISGVYLDAAESGGGSALERTTLLLAAVLCVSAACARCATRHPGNDALEREPSPSRT